MHQNRHQLSHMHLFPRLKKMKIWHYLPVPRKVWRFPRATNGIWLNPCWGGTCCHYVSIRRPSLCILIYIGARIVFVYLVRNRELFCERMLMSHHQFEYTINQVRVIVFLELGCSYRCRVSHQHFCIQYLPQMNIQSWARSSTVLAIIILCGRCVLITGTVLSFCHINTPIACLSSYRIPLQIFHINWGTPITHSSASLAFSVASCNIAGPGIWIGGWFLLVFFRRLKHSYCIRAHELGGHMWRISIVRIWPILLNLLSSCYKVSMHSTTSTKSRQISVIPRNLNKRESSR